MKILTSRCTLNYMVRNRGDFSRRCSHISNAIVFAHTRTDADKTILCFAALQGKKYSYVYLPTSADSCITDKQITDRLN